MSNIEKDGQQQDTRRSAILKMLGFTAATVAPTAMSAAEGDEGKKFSLSQKEYDLLYIG